MVAALAFPILAYVDTSAALAIAFRESGWELTARRLAGLGSRYCFHPTCWNPNHGRPSSAIGKNSTRPRYPKLGGFTPIGR